VQAESGRDAEPVTGPAQLFARRAVLTKVLGAVGVVLLIVGVVFAVRPVSVNNRPCGSVFQPEKGITPMQCDAQLNSRADVVTGFGAGGVVIVLAGFAIAAVRDRRTRVSS
jgi:hypothetical protein